MRTLLSKLIFAVSCCSIASGAAAQTIYPIDRAAILAGSRFDVKVEHLGPAHDIRLTINGQDAERFTGITAQRIEAEDGGKHSAVWLRDVTLPRAGTFEVLATSPTGSQSVTWNVYETAQRKARNVILFVGDGLSVAHRTAARILSKGLKQGKYNGRLAIDDMPHMALVSTAGTDSIITDSANAMSAYTTGHKTCVGALGVYCSRSAAHDAHPRVETLTSLAHRVSNMAVGIVTTSELSDATPAAMVAHTRQRSEMGRIVEMMFAAKPAVLLGGGAAQFLPKAEGGSREDDRNFVDLFKQNGYAFADNATTLKAHAKDAATRQLLGLFNARDIDGALDRRILRKGTTERYPDQPDLVEQTEAALDVLSRNPNGFALMVESARIDKYSHSLDWERAVYDTIMFDNAVAVAKSFAAARNDTLIVVVPDHAHPISIVGTFDDAKAGTSPRQKLSVYGEAGYPNYAAPDNDGYPANPNVSRRLAVLFGAYPDHCFSGQPSLGREFVPSVKSPDGPERIANEDNCRAGAVRLFGNLPFDAPQGVHAGDDVILTAIGPGADVFRGQIDNTDVFKGIAEALGLGSPAP